MILVHAMCLAIVTPPHEMLRLAQSAAVAAGRHMITRLGAAVEATKLDEKDLVTAVDAECQEIVFGAIQERCGSAVARTPDA